MMPQFRTKIFHKNFEKLKSIFLEFTPSCRNHGKYLAKFLCFQTHFEWFLKNSGVEAGGAAGASATTKVFVCQKFEHRSFDIF